MLAWLPLLLLPFARAAEPAPPADPAVVEAEHQRIAGEMAQLAARQLWVGLEQRFQECAALPVELTFQDLVYGAHAARGLGDVQGARDRLEAAARLQDSREVADWLRSIDTSYGRVQLRVQPSRDARLEADAYPFAPDQRAAVDHAVEVVRASGVFDGLLPRGTYHLEGRSFVVEPGLTVHLEVSPRQRRDHRRRAPDGSEARAGEE